MVGPISFVFYFLFIVYISKSVVVVLYAEKKTNREEKWMRERKRENNLEQPREKST